MYRQLRGSRKRVRIGDVDKAPRIYTDNINQMCLVRCKLCSRQGPHFTTIQQCCGTGCGKNLLLLNFDSGSGSGQIKL